MPSLDFYRRQKNKGMTIGQHHKMDSDMIMEATWDNDIASRVIWLYDQEHDDQFNDDFTLDPTKSKTKIPVEAKFFEMEYNSLAKDQTSQHIMFKPSYVPNISYYDEEFKQPYGSTFPIGLFADIGDSRGIYHRWLIVGQYREYSNQFPSYMVLPADYKLKWIYKNKKYESWVVLRSQNSYNAGYWTGDKFTTLQNQKIVWAETNDITKTIFYDQRVAIGIDREIPVVWLNSKVEDTDVCGITHLTFKQDVWDPTHDYVERDDQGKMIGIWCNYFDDSIEPTKPDQPVSSQKCIVSYSGVKPEIKIGGSYKKLTADFYNNDAPIDFQQGEWKFIIDNSDAAELLEIKTDSTDLNPNQIKIKFKGDDTYISKILTIKYISIYGIIGSVDISLVGL